MCILDLTNITCPWTIIQTRQAMDQLSTGQNLLITTSDPSFHIDLQVYLNRTGQKLKSTWNENKVIFYLLEK